MTASNSAIREVLKLLKEKQCQAKIVLDTATKASKEATTKALNEGIPNENLWQETGKNY